jgi:hypothetical protein
LTWLNGLRRYLVFLAVANLVWEAAHMPLYTVWNTDTGREMVFYWLHCVAGDILIGGSALLAPLLLFGSPRWPKEGYAVVAAWTVLFGLAYTVFSEWFNVQIRGSWSYSELMPVLPGLGVGLSPLAQWVVIPAVAFWWARRARAITGKHS